MINDAHDDMAEVRICTGDDVCIVMYGQRVTPDIVSGLAFILGHSFFGRIFS